MFRIRVRTENDVVESDISEEVDGGMISFIAAHPIEKRYGRHAATLPYTNYAQAFQGTPNIGDVNVHNGRCVIDIVTPN
jgi:hypothetical protein